MLVFSEAKGMSKRRNGVFRLIEMAYRKKEGAILRKAQQNRRILHENS